MRCSPAFRARFPPSRGFCRASGEGHLLSALFPLVRAEDRLFPDSALRLRVHRALPPFAGARLRAALGLSFACFGPLLFGAGVRSALSGVVGTVIPCRSSGARGPGRRWLGTSRVFLLCWSGKCLFLFCSLLSSGVGVSGLALGWASDRRCASHCLFSDTIRSDRSETAPLAVPPPTPLLRVSGGLRGRPRLERRPRGCARDDRLTTTVVSYLVEPARRAG